ncbi:hypothetical protein [uncultured Fibrella sp.]|uniref:hypothetical protein n=1 Tax=uncultured Fibrella sp. TaxID=1284596 RepID=UPI0035C9AE17
MAHKLKIRLCCEDQAMVEKAVDVLTTLFPDLRFSAARLGNNPKYADSPKYFSYGEPRTKNGQPVPVDLEAALPAGKKAIKKSPVTRRLT